MEIDKGIMKIKDFQDAKNLRFLCITADINRFLEEQEIAARQLKSIQRWINTRLDRQDGK